MLGCKQTEATAHGRRGHAVTKAREKKWTQQMEAKETPLSGTYYDGLRKQLPLRKPVEGEVISTPGPAVGWSVRPLPAVEDLDYHDRASPRQDKPSQSVCAQHARLHDFHKACHLVAGHSFAPGEAVYCDMDPMTWEERAWYKAAVFSGKAKGFPRHTHLGLLAPDYYTP